MLHNNGNIIPYYGEDLGGYITTPAFINKYSHTMQCYSIFIEIFKISNTNYF